jgi:hypothetical protein
MQLLSLALLIASALVVADTSNGGEQGQRGHTWVPDFDNLVAFGDRLGHSILTNLNGKTVLLTGTQLHG